jgi:hypothetical protein
MESWTERVKVLVGSSPTNIIVLRNVTWCLLLKQDSNEEQLSYSTARLG